MTTTMTKRNWKFLFLLFCILNCQVPIFANQASIDVTKRMIEANIDSFEKNMRKVKLKGRYFSDGRTSFFSLENLILKNAISIDDVIHLFHYGARLIKQDGMPYILLEVKTGGEEYGRVSGLIDPLDQGIFDEFDKATKAMQNVSKQLLALKKQVWWNDPEAAKNLIDNDIKDQVALKIYQFLQDKTHLEDLSVSSILQTIAYNPLELAADQKFSSHWWKPYMDFYLGGFDGNVRLENAYLWTQSDAYKISGDKHQWKNFSQADILTHDYLNSFELNQTSKILKLSDMKSIYRLKGHAEDGMYKEARGNSRVEIVRHLKLGGKIGSENKNAKKYVEYTRIYRTYLPVHDSRYDDEVLSAAETVKMAKLRHPETWAIGDELVSLREGELSGTFITGVKGNKLKQMISIDSRHILKGSYEVSARKLSSKVIEVVVAPKTVLEFSEYRNLLKSLNSQKELNIFIAKKQGFLFNIEDKVAMKAYKKLIFFGVLPVRNHSTVSLTMKSESPDYFLELFQMQNDKLETKGIVRTYYEHVDVFQSHFQLGLDLPILQKQNAGGKFMKFIPSIGRWSGLSIDQMLNKAQAIMTNGSFAIVKNSKESKLRSNAYEQKTFATIQDLYLVERGVEYSAFQELNLQAIFQSTHSITKEENNLVRALNGLFSTNLTEEKVRDKHWKRTVLIERKLVSSDLDQLASSVNMDNITQAVSRVNDLVHLKTIHGSEKLGIFKGEHSGPIQKILGKLGLNTPAFLPITEQTAFNLISKLKKDSVHQLQAKTIQEFVKTHGLRGVALIHQLLGGDGNKIGIASVGNYDEPVLYAFKFAINYKDFLDKKHNPFALKKYFVKKRDILKFIDYKLTELQEDPFVQKSLKLDALLAARELVEMTHQNNIADLSDEDELRILRVSNRKTRLIKQKIGPKTNVPLPKNPLKVRPWKLPKIIKHHYFDREFVLSVQDRAKILNAEFGDSELSEEKRPMRRFRLIYQLEKDALLKMKNLKENLSLQAINGEYTTRELSAFEAVLQTTKDLYPIEDLDQEDTFELLRKAFHQKKLYPGDLDVSHDKKEADVANIKAERALKKRLADHLKAIVPESELMRHQYKHLLDDEDAKNIDDFLDN